MSQTPFEVTRRVEFHETDLAGIVHFANFFRYMESAEHEFLRSLGHHIHGKTDGLETGWPRVNATCDYRRPARFGDELTIRVSIEEVRTRSVRYGFEFLVGGETIATGSLTAAHVELADGEIKAVAIPGDLREILCSRGTSLPVAEQEGGPLPGVDLTDSKGLEDTMNGQ